MKSLFRGITACFAIVGLLGASAALAEDDAPSGRVTFTKDVLPILQENCQVCHRPLGLNSGGMIAPMSFTNYADVRPWAKSIVTAIESGEMPPWHASKATAGVFANERGLTDKEAATIAKWVRTGAARGKASDAPPPKEFSVQEWAIGEPDLIVTFDEPYFVEDDIEDFSTNISTLITEEQLPEDRWIKGMEFKPGSAAVHHIIAFTRTAGGGGMLGGIAPGNAPDMYPDGYGVLLRAGTTLIFQMHYHKEPGPGTGVFDQSEVAFTFHDKDVDVKPLTIEAIGNRGFEIPPNHSNWVIGAAKTYTRDIKILGLMPHAHLRAVGARYRAFYPDGTEELLLDVPRYDFNWQTSYEFKEMKKIPAGTRLEVQMWYDNSADNPSNPDPTRAVRFASPTTDEMMLGWLTWAYDDDAGQE